MPDVSPDEEARFAFQLRMLEKGASEIQAQVARLDDLLFKIKASFITVWAAMIGWAFATRTFPPNFVFPLTLRETEWDHLRLWTRGLLSPFVATLYLFVGLATYLLWIAAPFGD